MPLETEIKIRISDLGPVRVHLRNLGFRVHLRRVLERNTIFDSAGKKLGRKGELLRIRQVRGETRLTYKGPTQKGPHKSREEIELLASDAGAMEEIIARLQLRPVFRYEKYRTEYTRRGQRGVITVDETPIGNYLEIEGSPKWIDATACELGYSPSQYITKSYGALYGEYCRRRHIKPSNMVFRVRAASKGAHHRRTPDR